jgi:hypothetical protein|tara:strand:- start:2803 stop:3207 length:405 start_codon:yes stop_codon:yes gene_type:complete
LLTFQSCKEEDDANNPPTIRLIGVQPTTVTEFTDSIVFTIEYEDIDGDIGYPNADSLSLWLLDARLLNPDRFFIPPLAPLDARVHIVGEFDIILPNTFRLGAGPQEVTSYKLWLKDRAGNYSNEIETPMVTILE